jgi:hypothetical protein
MNPLIFVPSPRDIPEFLEATAKIECDKLWLKYYNEDDAYRMAREWFLKNEQYTHLVILPDDLIITQSNFDTLLDDAEYYEVVSGWCRNTIRLRDDWKGPPETEEQADSSFSTSLPPDPPYTGTYDKFDFVSVDTVMKMRAFGMYYIKVKFSGFPLVFLSRYIVKAVPFRTSQGCCVDSCLALDLHKAGLNQWVDLSVRTTHIQTHFSILKVNKEKPDMYFEKRK